MEAEALRQRLEERAVCEAQHAQDRVPHNGLRLDGHTLPEMRVHVLR